MTQVSISKGIVLDVDFDKIMAHESVVAAAVRFAVKQALTNTHAGIKSEDPEVVAKSKALAEKRLAAMYAGTWGSVEVGARVDPVTRVMRELAIEDLRPALKKIGKKPADYAKEVWNAVVEKQVKAREAAYRAAAVARLAITVEPAESEVDIDALGLVETPAAAE